MNLQGPTLLKRKKMPRKPRGWCSVICFPKPKPLQESPLFFSSQTEDHLGRSLSVNHRGDTDRRITT